MTTDDITTPSMPRLNEPGKAVWAQVKSVAVIE
jgi:hypothetical protein